MTSSEIDGNADNFNFDGQRHIRTLRRRTVQDDEVFGGTLSEHCLNIHDSHYVKSLRGHTSFHLQTILGLRRTRRGGRPMRFPVVFLLDSGLGRS